MKCEYCGHEHKDCGEIQSLLVDELQLMRLSIQAMESCLAYWSGHPELKAAVRAGHERLLAAVDPTGQGDNWLPE